MKKKRKSKKLFTEAWPSEPSEIGNEKPLRIKKPKKVKSVALMIAMLRARKK